MTELAELPAELFIYKFHSLAAAPLDALMALGPPSFWSLTVAPDEVSVVGPKMPMPGEVPVVGPWAGFRVAGILDFALTGILASLTTPLASAQISVFSVSTYDTDYLLVPRQSRDAAVASWTAAGIAVESAAHD